MTTIDELLPLSKRELQREQINLINALQNLFADYKQDPSVIKKHLSADETKAIVSRGPRDHYVTGETNIYVLENKYLVETSGIFSSDVPSVKDRLAMSNPHVNTIDGIQVIWNGVQIIRELFGYENLLDMNINASSTKLIKGENLDFKAQMFFDHQDSIAKYATLLSQEKAVKAMKGYGYYESPVHKD